MPSVQQKVSRLQALPYELLVKLVADYVDVDDIFFRVPLLNRFFRALTQDDAFWARVVASGPPLPRVFSRPLPPIERFTRPSRYDLLAQAHALERAWTAPAPLVDEWAFDAHFRVHELLVLPGARHLLAAVTFRWKGVRRWGVVLYSLAGTRGPIPLLFLPTLGLPHGLTAKFINVAFTRADRETRGAFMFAFGLNDGCKRSPASRSTTDEEGKALDAEWLRDGLRSYHEGKATEWKVQLQAIALFDLHGLEQKCKDIVPDTPAFEEHIKVIKSVTAPKDLENITWLQGITRNAPLSAPQLLQLIVGDPHHMVLAVSCGPHVVVQQTWKPLPCKSWTIELNADAEGGRATAHICSFKFLPETKQITVVRRDSRPTSSDKHVQLFDIPEDLLLEEGVGADLDVIPTRASLAFTTQSLLSTEVHIGTIEKNPPWSDCTPGDPMPVERMPAMTISASPVTRSGVSGLRKWTIRASPAHLHRPGENGSAYQPLEFYVPDLSMVRLSHNSSAVPMLEPHYCWKDWHRAFAPALDRKEWRPIAGPVGTGRQLVYAVDRPSGARAPRVAGLYRLCEFPAPAVHRVPVSLPLHEQGVTDYSKLVAAWDDSMGRVCWTFPGSTTIRVVDLVPLAFEHDARATQAPAGAPTIMLTSPTKSGFGEACPSPTLTNRFSKRLSAMTQLEFFFWADDSPTKKERAL
ncbi:hypothetical protein PsYK624_151960 [Phanerochaete sordida]|uniref:F-box domain-containing protein n=1 Tax=Phanerochaete sordida TaxID=48140 RepID=A0A9P3GNC7_9APHY|nr:hypothetical protein PsYK624_151960 [Phanerochaete sordida]